MSSRTRAPKSTSEQQPAKRTTTRKRTSSKPPATPKRPPGRPSELRRVVREIPASDDGKRPARQLTVHDVIVEEVDRGNYVEMACGMAGVTKRAVYTWLQHGARIAKARHDPKPSIDLDQLTDHDVACEAFVHAVDAAESRAFARNLRAVEALCEGGRQITKTKRTVRGGRVVAEETTTETTLPDAATVRWRAERRWPNLLGRMGRIEISGVDGGPIEIDDTTRTEGLLADLERIAERHAESTRLLDEAEAELAAVREAQAISDEHDRAST